MLYVFYLLLYVFISIWFAFMRIISFLRPSILPQAFFFCEKYTFYNFKLFCARVSCRRRFFFCEKGTFEITCLIDGHAKDIDILIAQGLTLFQGRPGGKGIYIYIYIYTYTRSKFQKTPFWAKKSACGKIPRAQKAWNSGKHLFGKQSLEFAQKRIIDA